MWQYFSRKKNKLIRGTLGLGLKRQFWYCIKYGDILKDQGMSKRADLVSLVGDKTWWYGYYVHASLTVLQPYQPLPPAFSSSFPPPVFHPLLCFAFVFWICILNLYFEIVFWICVLNLYYTVWLLPPINHLWRYFQGTQLNIARIANAVTITLYSRVTM